MLSSRVRGGKIHERAVVQAAELAFSDGKPKREAPPVSWKRPEQNLEDHVW